MTAKPPSSSGCTTPSTPPAPAADSTTPAAPASADNWERRGLGQIGRGPFRISKAFVHRKHIGVTACYHAFCRFAFLGTFPTVADAQAYCDAFPDPEP